MDYVPKDQPEWLEDHRHNCNTFYAYIGDRDDLSGLRATVTVEGQTFVADAPSAVLIPQYALHHYKLTEGSGWSFHINLRSDYEESIALPGEADASRIPSPDVEDILKTAQRQDEERDAGPRRWSFIDDRFARPGIRLTVYSFAGPITGRIEGRRLMDDGVSLLVGAPGETLFAEVRSGDDVSRAASPAAVYHPKGTLSAYERVEGAGFIVDAELERA